MAARKEFAEFARRFKQNSPTNPIQLERALHRIGMLVSAHAVTLAPIDTGNLRNHIFYSVAMRTNGGEVVVGVKGVPYAAAQEFGGRLTSSGKMYTVPLNPRAKALRRDVRSLRGQGLIRIGKLLVDRDILQSARDDDEIPEAAKMFVLKRSIYMKPKRYMYRAIQKSEPTIIDILRSLGNGE